MIGVGDRLTDIEVVVMTNVNLHLGINQNYADITAANRLFQERIKDAVAIAARRLTKLRQSGVSEDNAIPRNGQIPRLGGHHGDMNRVTSSKFSIRVGFADLHHQSP
jgi:hypothetical protein